MTCSSDCLIFWPTHEVTGTPHPTPPCGRVLAIAYGDIHACSFSPAGDMLAMALTRDGIDLAMVLSVEQGIAMAELEGHCAAINHVEFVPARDEEAPTLVLTASDDRTFKVWDLQSRTMLYSSPIVSSSPFTSLSVDPNNARFALGSEDGKIRIYALPSGHSTSLHTVGLILGQGSRGAHAYRLCHTVDLAQQTQRRHEAWILKNPQPRPTNIRHEPIPYYDCHPYL